MGFGEHAAWFAFTSDRFDHSSELPAEANAGNRFYGRDVASFVAEGLSERGLDASFLDEDWGWQAHAKRPDGSVLEVSVYHNPDEDPAAEDDWALMVRSLRKERKLGISALPRDGGRRRCGRGAGGRLPRERRRAQADDPRMTDGVSKPPAELEKGGVSPCLAQWPTKSWPDSFNG